MSQLSPDQEHKVRAVISETGLSPWENELVALAQNAIVLELSVPTKESTGLSRLGGLPMVPPGWEWPGELFFYGQLDLSTIAPLDVADVLPNSGLLLFFGAQDYEGGINGEPLSLQCRVFHFENTQDLVESPAPAGFLPVGLGSYEAAIYRPMTVTPRAQISLPTSYTSAARELEESGCTGWDALEEAVNAPHSSYGRPHQMLGHHGFCDGDMEGVLNLSPEDESLGEWLLLLQLDSDDRLGTQFCDAGVYFFGIAACDLKAARFDRVRAGFWTS